jgi:hypothetical protein
MRGKEGAADPGPTVRDLKLPEQQEDQSGRNAVQRNVRQVVAERVQSAPLRVHQE